MNAFIIVMHFALVMMLIRRSGNMQLKGFSIHASYLLFSLKCVAGILLFRYYSGLPGQGDTVMYFRESEMIFRLFLKDPLSTLKLMLSGEPLPADGGMEKLLWNEQRYLPFFNDVHTVIISNVFLRIFSFGNFAVHIIWMNVLAWMGICRIHNSFTSEGRAKLTSLLPYLFPQFILWNSAILKEPFMLFGLGLIIGGMSGIYNKSKNGWFLFATGCFLFIWIKTFIFLLILPALIVMVYLSYRNPHPVWKSYALAYLILFVALIAAGTISESFHLPSVLSSHQLSMYRFAVYSGAGSILEPVTLAPSWISFVKRLPESAGYALMQPFPWIYQFRLAWPVFIENCVVLVLMLAGVYLNRRSLVNDPLRFGLLISGFIILAVVGFTTPVAGNLVRYKMPAIFMILLSVWLPPSNNAGLNQNRSGD